MNRFLTHPPIAAHSIPAAPRVSLQDEHDEHSPRLWVAPRAHVRVTSAGGLPLG